MATYQITAPDGNKYKLTGPDNASQQDLIGALLAQHPMAGQSTAELESAKSAPMSFGDTARSIGSGLVGGGKSLVDFFGTGTGLSKGLGEASDYLQQGLTPQRKAEIARRQELQDRAAQSGSLFQEAKAFLGGVAEAPIQSIGQALGSSAPSIIAGIVALPVEAPAILAIGVGTIAKLAVGAMQGVGEMKGGVHDAVKAEYMRQGYKEPEAEKLAIESSEYSRKTALQTGGAALLGALDAVTGVEPSVGKAMRKAAPTGALTKEAIDAGIKALPEKALKAPTYGKQILKGIAEEAPLEGAQGAFGQYGENVAMQQAGADVTPGQGVLGAGLRDAAVGALFGGAASPLGMKSARHEFATDEFLRQAKATQELDKEKADALKEQQETRAKTEQGLGIPKMLALPAPAKAAEEEKNPLQNPVGRITADDLGSQLHNSVKAYRKDNNLPPLKTYSVEDVKDALSSRSPEEQEGILNKLLIHKTGYTDETYTPQAIQDRAVQKNVATETKGWNDFLTRATGKSDLNTMTQPELHTVSKALDALPRTGKEEQLVLPEGSNASRFTQDQYDAGITAALLGDKPVTLDEALKRVQTQKGVDSDQSAERILRAAASNDDLVIEKGTGFQAVSKTGAVLGTYATEEEAKQNHRRVDITPVETDIVRAREEEKTDKVAQLPEGYAIKTKTVAGESTPAAYVLRQEGSPKNESQTFAEQIDAERHLDLLTRKREALAASEMDQAESIRKKLEKQQTAIAQMEAEGKTDTAEHKNAISAFKAADVAASDKIAEHTEKAEALRQPLKIVPLGRKTAKVEKHTVTKGGKEIGTFTGDKGKTGRTKAEEHVLAQASEAELQTIADRGGVFGKRAETELQSRKTPGIRATAEGLEKAGVHTPEVEAKLAELKAKLLPMLKKFGLEQVGLNVIREIENNADGAWGRTDKLIRIALKATEPIKTMRHEALHALKELGFFTPQQWEALKRQAEKTWVNKYLKGVAFNDTMSRFDAYTQMGLSDEAILEEAIADAFGDWEGGATPPPGLMAALFKRLQNFFTALRQALTGAGFESADEIFGKIERGELEAGKEEAGTEEKMSLSGIGVPMSTRNLMEVQTPVAQQELGLNTEAKRGRFNNVREIAKALNQFTIDHLGAMDRKELTQEDSTKIAKAIADEVAFQLNTLTKTGTGLGWYSTNYPNAVKRLANRFPELGTSRHARSVFSAIVAVTSNGERVAKNIDNAIKLYAKLREGKPMVAMGNRRGTALKNNLAQIQQLLADHGQDFEKVLLKEITVKEMNAKLSELGEDTDNSYLANTVVPAAAVYFGPKLGAFYANLSGSEGYLTMDLWWTRSINRMRGLLMPKATEASINKFRDMMDRPSATREEVVSATIPFRDKYEEYGFNTELEHLAGSKEPRTNAKKPAWFKKAEERAGDAFEQLLFDHNIEKMANTIYKNEFEMLEEAPFTATDRKFMYDAARKAQSLLQKEGIDLTLADIQAALWYYEKRLYQKLSGRKADDIGYEEAIIAQANQGNGRARPSVVFDQQPSSGTQPGGKGAKTVGVRGQPASTSTEQGVSGEQKYSLGKNADRVSFVGPAFDERKLRGAGDRGRGSEVRSLAPLEGSPSVKGFSGPDPRLVSIAEQYAKDNGIDYKRQNEYVQVDEDRARRIADAYDEMPHAPQDPEVKEAYQNLIRQTRAQYDALVKNGYRFWFTDYNIPENAEYLSSPWNAMRDIRKNKTMGVFPTDEGFGQGDFDPAANPLLEDTGLKWPVGGPNGTKKSRVLANDLFRAVHDAFGHGLEGAGFRARGEENAWLAHSKLFTGSALAAITSETRGQNSWLNYGPQGEKNRNAKIEDTTFADQKTGLMPSWTWNEGREKYSLKFADPALKPKQGEGIVLGEKQPNATSFVGLHYGQNKVDELSGSKYGSGIKGAERRRLQETDDQRIKKRIYFYIPKEDGSMPRNEAGLGGHVYTQQFDNIASGPEVDRLYGEAGGDANTFESNVVDAGYDGYAMPSMGMMVILNNNAPVDYHGTMGELAQSDKKFSLPTYFPTAEEAENAAYKKAPPSTPEFKRFFGASKVKEEGRAQPMFHASMEDFNIFRENRPIFISPDAGFAEDFIKRRISESDSLSYLSEGEVKKKTAKIYPLWVRAETPFDYDNKQHVQKVVDYLQANHPVTAGRITMGGGLGAMSVDDIVKDLRSGKWNVIENHNTQEALKVLGFDSFYTAEGGAKNLAVFKANQVKSITGNLGGFDEGGDIRYSLPNIGAAADARVNETSQAREHKGVIARILDAFAPESLADLRASFIHRYNRLGFYDQKLAEKMGGKVLLADMSAEAAANMSDLSASVTYAAFGIGNRKGGVPRYKNGATIIDTSVKGPLEILSPLAQFNDPKAYQHYQYWAGVKRGTRFLASGKEENYEVGDIALAEKVRKEYLAKGVDFTTIQKEMNNFNDGLVDYMVTTGVLSPEKAKEFKKHMDYIPFYRQLNGEDTVGPKIFNSISGVKPPKKLKGSEAPLTDYLESIVQNTQAAINSGMKNMAAQRAISVAMQLGPIAGAQKLTAVSSAPDCITVLENGQAVSYRVADQLFVNAVKSLNMVDMPWLGIFSAPSNVLRNLVTKDPGFMLANLARDSLSAWVTSGTNMTPIIGTAANFVAALGGKSPIYHALLNAGILGGYEFSSGVMKSAETFQGDLNKKYGSNKGALPLRAFKGVWEALEQGTEASDAATRMAVYERVLAETGNETEALYRALEVMNFNRKGSSPIARILTAAIPFLNARIQGLDVFYRTAMGQNVSANAKEMQKAFFVRGATLMALSAAYFLAVSDDDEWKKQEQETKDNYWIFPGVGKFPTPFEVGFLFKTVPERLMALTFKDDTSDDFKASMQRGLLNTFAFNPIPQVAKPIIEYNANYNFFTGRPIVGQGMEGLEAQYQIGPNTTKVAEVMGKALGMPPIKLDQLINSYTGTMGMYAMTAIDSVLDMQSNSPNASKRFEQLPIVKRFAVDPEARGNITQFYELKKAVDAAVQTENLLKKAGNPEDFMDFMEKNKGLLAVKPYVANIEKSMKQMREMRKMVQGAEMSGDEKRDTLTALGQMENNLTTNIQTVKKMVSEL